MSKKIELRVQTHGEKCKPTIMKTVAKVSGVKSITMDSEKSILTIIGTVDVVEVVKQLKKAKKPAEVMSVGPEKPPEKKDEKKDGDKKDGDKKDGDKKDDKKDGEKKHECSCNPSMPCYCYYPHQSGYMPPPHGYPPVVVYDQSPYGSCTIF